MQCELTVPSYESIPLPPFQPKQYKPVLDVVNTPHCIRAIISSFGHSPSGRPKQNIIILEEIAKELGYRLILHPSK
jgi:hypothetical protein